jgi:hypothetical protein
VLWHGRFPELISLVYFKKPSTLKPKEQTLVGYASLRFQQQGLSPLPGTRNKLESSKGQQKNGRLPNREISSADTYNVSSGVNTWNVFVTSVDCLMPYDTEMSVICDGIPSESFFYHENSPPTGIFKFTTTYVTDVYRAYLLSLTWAPLLSRDVAARRRLSMRWSYPALVSDKRYALYH